MLELAQVNKGDVVYDLGSGDGRIVITAAKKYGARAVGFEIDPERITQSRESIRKQGLEKLAEIREQDILTVDLSQANVLTRSCRLYSSASSRCYGANIVRWPVVVGFAGACALLYGSLLLVREARLAVRSTLQEVSFAQDAVVENDAQRIQAETGFHTRQRKNVPLFYATLVSREFFKSAVGNTERRK